MPRASSLAVIRAVSGILIVLAAVPTLAAPRLGPRTGIPDAPPCAAELLPGLSAQHARIVRTTGRIGSGAALDPGEADERRARRLGLREDLDRIVRVVFATDTAQAGARQEPADDVGFPSLAGMRCDAAVRGRDRHVWHLTLAGYSALEIADVVAGHLTRADLDRAQAMLMAGSTRAAVSAYLERRWRREPARSRGGPPVASPRARVPARFEGALAKLAAHHGIAPALVRAVIEAESGGDPRAVSPAGAIGLMQLMPATAAGLGVDPWDPLDNLRGGIAYLAGLLRAYADPTLALVAYNAGPQHADRVRAGRAVPYRETRRYLDAIRAHYPLP
jgi:hypothetical protein